jgi:hypothetical protein
MERYRITTQENGAEQTWVLLPDRPSAVIQAEELWQRQKSLHVRVYHEVSETPPAWSKELTLDLPPKSSG